MKALIVVNLAGFLSFLWDDIKTLQNMGYEVTIAMNGMMSDGSEAVEIAMLNNLGIRHYQIDWDTKNPISKKNYVAYKQISQIMKSEYDLIHCHTPIVGLITRLAAIKYRKRGCKVIYTTHGFAFTDRSSKKTWAVYFSMEKFASRFCDAIITINHEDYYNAKKMHCKNVYVISSVGIDNHRFKNINIDRDEYRKSFDVNKNDIMVLAVGELSERKNHQVIIKALGNIKEKDKYVFVVCGRAVINSNLEQSLKRLAKELEVRVYFAGHRLDIPEINKCADIAVIPSIREGFGLAGVEALASGCPVIGSDVQGIREYVIPNKTGYLCDPYSADEFAEAIRRISKLSEKERDAMSEECRKTALKFDKSISKLQMKNIYKNI